MQASGLFPSQVAVVRGVLQVRDLGAVGRDDHQPQRTRLPHQFVDHVAVGRCVEADGFAAKGAGRWNTARVKFGTTTVV